MKFLAIPRGPSGLLISRRVNLELLIELTPWIEDKSNKSIKERVYCLENKITSYPTCKVCTNPVYFIFSHGKYSETCSKICKEKHKVNKIKMTNYIKYGVENVSQVEEVKQKKKDTFLEHFGVICNLINYQEYQFTSTFRPPIHSQQTKDKMSISVANHFKARRNAEDTDYAGVVYILHFPEQKAVKIGLAGDFKRRSKELIRDFGEYNIVDMLQTETCYGLETELHEKYNDYRICLEEGGGRTEFFKEEILILL